MKEMTDAGVNVGLGVDGSASNDTGHMLHEVRLAMFLQRAGGDPLGSHTSLHMHSCRPTTAPE